MANVYTGPKLGLRLSEMGRQNWLVPFSTATACSLRWQQWASLSRHFFFLWSKHTPCCGLQEKSTNASSNDFQDSSLVFGSCCCRADGSMGNQCPRAWVKNLAEAMSVWLCGVPPWDYLRPLYKHVLYIVEGSWNTGVRRGEKDLLLHGSSYRVGGSQHSKVCKIIKQSPRKLQSVHQL